MTSTQRQTSAQNLGYQDGSASLTAANAAALRAQRDQVQALQQANTAYTNSMQAGLQAGMLQGQYSAAQSNYDKRIKMVQNAFSASRPKGYSNSSAPVTLSDPFADPSSVTPDRVAFQHALADHCLEMGDVNHPAAHATSCNAKAGGCARTVSAGLYPVLTDGRFIDSSETLTIYVHQCKDPAAKMVAVTEDGRLVEVK